MPGLKKEIAAYERMRGDLELEHFGKWIVVHDEKLTGIYDSFEVAADNAVQRFGRGPYLIKRVGEPPMTLPASVLYSPLNELTAQRPPFTFCPL